MPDLRGETEACLDDDQRYYHLFNLKTVKKPMAIKGTPYHVSKFMDYNDMRLIWRDMLLDALIEHGALDGNYVLRLKRRYPKGFMLNGFIQDHRGDRNLMKRMASYIAKLPISESRILAYEPNKEKVLIKYRGVASPSKLPGERRSFKNLLELMNPLEFIARVVQHIPDPSQQMIRYFGIYSNAARGKRKRLKKCGAPDIVEADFQPREKYRKNWRKLLWKIFSVDPLVCPKCGTKMRWTKRPIFHILTSENGDYDPSLLPRVAIRHKIRYYLSQNGTDQERDRLITLHSVNFCGGNTRGEVERDFFRNGFPMSAGKQFWMGGREYDETVR